MSEQLRVYGLDLSYFTGKLEGYLRYKEIPFERVELTYNLFRQVARKTGIAQMTAVERADGRWMTDTTAIMAALESEFPQPAVVPPDPVQAWFSLFLEEYADEWLWRPALHYRWSFQPDAGLMSDRLAREMLRDLPLPLFIRRSLIHQRQLRKYVSGDGINPATRPHVESIYLQTLDQLQHILCNRPYLLGNRPTLADFGFYGPMFRHFGLDPTPSRIMRDRAPAVFEWVARMWNAKATRIGDASLLRGIPDDWFSILRSAASGFLPYLNANAKAFAEGRSAFELDLDGTHYHLPVHRYRVWCLQRLRERFEGLDPGAASEVAAILRDSGCWTVFWQLGTVRSGYDPGHRAPYMVPGEIWENGTKR